MSEGFLQVPLHFTVEFLGFLVAAGGALLVASRRNLIGGGAFNRLTAALGLAALAATHVMHGASFVEVDADDVLVALRTVGYVFIFFAVVGGLRGEPVAWAAISFQRPLLLAPAIAAGLLSLMAIMSSARERVRPLRRLSLAALLFAASEIFIGMAPDVSFLTGTVNEWGYVAHATRLLGYLALASWLWSGVRASIRLRFVVSFAALLVVVVLALASALTGVIANNVEQSELSRVEEELSAVSLDLNQEVSSLLIDVRQVATSADIRSIVAGRTNVQLVARQLQREAVVNIDFIVFMSPSRRILGAAGEGPLVKRPSGLRHTRLRPVDILKIPATRVVEEVAGGTDVSSSLDSVGRRLVAVIAAAEITKPANNARSGIVAIGNFVDAGTMEEVSGPSFFASVVTGGRVVATDLPGRIPPSALVPESVHQSTVRGETVSRQQVLASRPYFSAFTRLESPGQVPVGTLVLSSGADLVTSTRQGVTRTLFIVAMGIGGFVLVLAWLSGRRITRPIQLLTKTAQAVREGDLAAQAPVAGDDEVGQLGETFNEMTSSLFRLTRDLKQAAREEHHLRARIETIIESMADGLVAVDQERKILAFNRQVENLTGIRAGQAIGTSVERIIDVRDPQGEQVHLPIYDLAEGSITGVFLVNRRGERVPVAVTSAVLLGEDGETAGAVAVVRDMTSEHQVERMKSEFLSNISHELRTPLTPIKGYAEILGRKEVPPAKVKQFVTGILDSTGKLERIVELLVDFAAMEAGRLAPRASPVDLGEIVERLAHEWQKRSPRHDVVAEIDGPLPTVLGDERLLRRSLEEIMDNAIKFSPDGGTVRVEARGVARGNGRRRKRTVELLVSDEGIGIQPEDLPNIFSDFRQIDGSVTRTFGGLGLGLAFVRRIVEQHDGEVAVESEPEQGTRFKITIPAAGTRK